jgi:acyl-CoA thioesterase FadM
MNLWFRLIWLLLTARSRPRLAAFDVSSLAFRVWPHDLDPSLHMNNGRYLAIMDLGRIDVIVRTGLLSAVLKHRWTPVVNAAVIRYRRELRLGDRYRLETRILAWDATAVIIEQVFRFVGGGRDGDVAARALVKGGFYDRTARDYVAVSRLLAEAGATAVSPSPAPEVAAFLATDEALRRRNAER